MPSERESGVSAESGAEMAAEAATAAHQNGTPNASTAPNDPTDPDGDEPIEWGPVRYERLRSLAVGFGLVVGVVLVTGFGRLVTGWGTALVTADGHSLLRGVSASDAFVFVVLLGAIAILVLPYAYLHYTEWGFGRSSRSDGEFMPSSFRPTWVLAGGLGPVAAWMVGLDWLTAVGVVILPLVWLLPVIAVQSGATHRIDPRRAALERTGVSSGRTRSDDLGAVVRTRRIDLPWTTLFLLAYRGNAWYRSTPWAFVPTELADEVEETLDAVVARSDGPDRASVPERVVLTVVGSSSLVVGVAVAIGAGEGAAGVVLALLLGPFSVLFLALAARL